MGHKFVSLYRINEHMLNFPFLKCQYSIWTIHTKLICYLQNSSCEGAKLQFSYLINEYENIPSGLNTKWTITFCDKSSLESVENERNFLLYILMEGKKMMFFHFCLNFQTGVDTWFY